jgi:hypothetical protein
MVGGRDHLRELAGQLENKSNHLFAFVEPRCISKPNSAITSGFSPQNSQKSRWGLNT